MWLTHQSQLAQSLLSCSTAFSILKQGRCTYLAFHFPSDLFCGPPGKQSRQFCWFSFFLFFFFFIMMGTRGSVCILKSHRSLCESSFRTGAGLCIYHLFVWLNWNFLHISQWITLPTQSCLTLYPFCANLLHSLIMWLIVSPLSPHSLHLLFCCVLYYYYYYFTPFEFFFYSSFNWGSFTRVCLTASPFKFLCHFWVPKQILTTLWSG